MAGQTVITYGRVKFYHCSTRRFEQVEIRDPSGADTLYTQYTVSIEGFTHGKGNVTGIRSEPIEPSAPEQFVVAGQVLALPRQDFEMRMGASEAGTAGVVLLAAKTADPAGQILNDRDVNNGPRCTSFRTTHVVADELFQVEATFEICLPNCVRNNSNLSRVLSNKWSVTDSINADRYTTRVYAGRLRINSGTVNPNSFRGLVVPTLVPGMKREEMIFEATADGLWLNYTITDKEAPFAAPAPATSWDIFHTEHSGDALKASGEISITLTADRYVNKKQLIALGLKILNDKLRGIRNAGDIEANRQQPQHVVDHIAVSDFISDSSPARVTITARVTHVLNGQQEGFDQNIIFQGRKLGALIDNRLITGYDPRFSRDGRPGETPQLEGPVPLVGAFVTYLQHACSPDGHDICSGDTLLLSPPVAECPGPNIEVRVVPELTDVTAPYHHESNQEGFYTAYQGESRYETPEHRAAMPIADDGGGSSGGGGGGERDTVAIVRLAPASTNRILRMSAARVGKEPELPEAVDEYQEGPTRYVLMRRVILPRIPTRTSDGHRLYAVDAEYHYAATRPAKARDRLRIGVNPWETGPQYLTTERLVGTYTEEEKS